MYTLIILFFLISICASFLCSVLEAVLLSISPAYAETQNTENPVIGQALADFQKNVDRPLAAILTLNTIAHTVGAIGVGAQATMIWGESITATLLVPVIMTLAILILSEIIPKTIGAVYWKELAGFTVKTLKIIIVLLGPLVAVSQFITRLLMKDKSKSVLSRADFTAMANLGVKEGVLDERESNFMRNFLKFDSVCAEDIMTPRTVLIAAPQEQSLSDFHQEHPNLRFSRVPIYAESIDHVTGYVIRDDVLSALLENKGNEALQGLRRELNVVELRYPLTDLFTYFINKHSHMALVVDKFGGTAGVVTMEDVIETLLGLEIVDEVDGEVNMQALAREQWRRRATRIGLIEP